MNNDDNYFWSIDLVPIIVNPVLGSNKMADDVKNEFQMSYTGLWIITLGGWDLGIHQKLFGWTVNPFWPWKMSRNISWTFMEGCW